MFTEFGSEPQIPHADDFCNRELFGIAHLHPDQPPTEAAPYAPDVPYPTVQLGLGLGLGLGLAILRPHPNPNPNPNPNQGVVVQCEACDTWLPLPDKVRLQLTIPLT